MGFNSGFKGLILTSQVRSKSLVTELAFQRLLLPVLHNVHFLPSLTSSARLLNTANSSAGAHSWGRVRPSSPQVWPIRHNFYCRLGCLQMSLQYKPNEVAGRSKTYGILSPCLYVLCCPVEVDFSDGPFAVNNNGLCSTVYYYVRLFTPTTGFLTLKSSWHILKNSLFVFLARQPSLDRTSLLLRLHNHTQTHHIW